jgi:hypothetical protein
VGPPESTSKGWILLFYGSGSKTGSTRGVFDRNVNCLNLNDTRNNLYWSNFADDLRPHFNLFQIIDIKSENTLCICSCY